MATIVLGLPCTPSKFISADLKLGYKILISYGGGMGGANRTIYAYVNEQTISVLENVTAKFINFTNINNEEVTINTDFIVMVSKCNLVTTKIDATEHYNYGKETKQKGSGEYKAVILKDTFEIGINDAYVFKDEYHTNSEIKIKSEKEIVKKYQLQ